MVLIHILCNSNSQSNDIVEVLLDKKLLFEAIISEKYTFKKLSKGKKESVKKTLVMGTTKALLFTKIIEVINSLFDDDIPQVYALPIIYMDDYHTIQLKAETEKV